jgi:hypothetical protein
METILKFFGAFVILALLLIVGFFLNCWRKDVRAANELKFDIMYQNLTYLLNYLPVTKTSQLKLMSYFDQLRACKFKNVEKVQVLWTNFVFKYKEVGKEFLEEDEFSIQDGDLDELSQVHNAQRDSQRFE